MLKDILAVIVLAVPLLLLLCILPRDQLGTSATSYRGLAERVDAYTSAFALGRGAAETLLGLALFLPIYVAQLMGIIALPRRFGRMLLLLILAALAAPVMLFGVYGVHIRLPLVVALVYLAALDVKRPLSRGPLALALAACTIALATLHFIVAGSILKAEDSRISELREADHLIAPGTKVLPVTDYQAYGRPGAINPITFFHIASYLVIDRDVFLPTLFGMFDLAVRDRYERLFPLQAAPPSYPDLTAAPGGQGASLSWAQLADYDYLVLFDQGSELPPPAGATLLHAGSYFKVFKLHAS